MALTPEQQAVKDASAAGQEKLRGLDAAALAALAAHYEAAARDLGQLVDAAAGAGGTVTPAALPSLMQQIQARLGHLSGVRDAALAQNIDEAAAVGVAPFTPTVNAAQLAAIRSEAAQAVHAFVGPDQLKLSDRIWRIDRHASEVVGQAVQNAVLRGDGAARAAREFLAKRIPLPADIALAKDAASAKSIGAKVEDVLLTGSGAPLDNAKRVMRTEINRAHSGAYQRGAAADPDSIGTQFLLSPRHPRVDICDMHARANLYGLGDGVYPHGRSPLPAHPNTLSFEVVKYRDEVTAADRAGRQSVDEFLGTVPGKDRKGILGVNKNEAFEAGKLPATQVRSRWRDVKRRIDRQSGG